LPNMLRLMPCKTRMFMVGLYRSMNHGHWMRELRLSVICGNIMSE